MKSSVSPVVAVIAIVIALAVAGIFAIKTVSSKPKASEDLTAKADISKLMSMTDAEKEKLRQDVLKAKQNRDSTTK